MLGQISYTMWVLEHVKFVDNVKLSVAKLRYLVSLSLTLTRFATLLDRLQLDKHFVFDGAVPAAYMAVVESS